MLRNFQSHAPGFSRPPGPLQRRAVRLTHARGAARSRAHSSRRERRTSPRTHTRDSPRTRATMSASVVRAAAATPALSARRGAGADVRGWPSSRAGEHTPESTLRRKPSLGTPRATPREARERPRRSRRTRRRLDFGFGAPGPARRSRRAPRADPGNADDVCHRATSSLFLFQLTRGPRARPARASRPDPRLRRGDPISAPIPRSRTGPPASETPRARTFADHRPSRALLATSLNSPPPPPPTHHKQSPRSR